MNKICYGILLIGLLLCGIMTVSSEAVTKKEKAIARKATKDKKVIAYVTESFDEMPDPNLVTHIYYAFGKITDSYDSLIITNHPKFERVAALKQTNPELKIILSLQAIPRDGFSRMTASDSLRGKFITRTMEVVEKYNLDGIDLDWEFPATNAGMQQGGAPDDPLHYSWLARDFRKALGPQRQLSMYSSNSGKYNDFSLMLPYLDYVMMSGYNLGNPPAQHQSTLYPSKKCGQWSISQSLQAHLNAGIPREKILLGIPFYARINAAPGKDNYVGWYAFDKMLPGYKLKWDKKAKASYYADSKGNLFAAFDTPRSIKEKSDFIKDEGLAGAFYWHYSAETPEHPLAKAVAKYLLK